MNEKEALKKNKPKALKPGVQSIASEEAARLDRRIAAKGEGDLQEFEAVVVSKEPRTAPPAVRPGVIGSGSAFTAPVKTDSAFTGASPASAAGATAALTDLEDSVARKATMQSATTTTANNETAAPSLSNSAFNGNNNAISSKEADQQQYYKEEPVMATSNKMDKEVSHSHNAFANKSGPGNTKENSVPEPMPAPTAGMMTTTADQGVVQEPDVEYGVYEPNEEGLAVAVAVTEEDDDVFIPSAVEYDPDAKPPLHTNRRVRLYGFLIFFALMSCAVGATIGIVVSGKNKGKVTKELPERERLGIRETVQALVGEQNLESLGSPYRKAVDWMIYEDPFELTPNNTTFVQRYVMAYFYFATTVEDEWISCNPPNITRGQNAQCTHQNYASARWDLYVPMAWVRWLSDTHECAWAGVFCDGMDQVRSIELPGYEMTGNFPEGVIHLPFLQGLSVGNNGLKGTLPTELSTMLHLVNLEAADNRLTGTIPEELWDNRNLIRLNLGGNRLEGTISSKVGQMRDIKGLFLDRNKLVGSLPSEIGNLQSLSFLRLSQNSLVGELPPSLTDLVSLEEMWISDNEFSGEFPTGIEKMVLLRDFRTRRNPTLGGRLLDDKFWSGHYFNIDIRFCNFSGTISPNVKTMTGLRHLRLSGNPITGTIPLELGGSNIVIESFWVDGTELEGPMPEAVCGRKSSNFYTEMVADCAGENPAFPCECCSICCDENGENCT